jgi:2'-5' RNA ligase
MHRLFIGIRPPESVGDLLVDAMEGIEGARWQDEANLHLTLRFIGEVGRPVANDLATALERISAAPFTVRIEGVGHFERKGRPHALWARIVPSEPLESLRQKVERAGESVGFERETRKFTPHITLARLNRTSGPIGAWLASFGDMRAEWEIGGFTLYESHLGHTGAHYEAIAEYPLLGSAVA